MNFDIKRTLKTDVLVVGGGTGGVFAAIAAARCGADVTLIEKNSNLGGTLTVGGVNFPGIFHAWGKQIISGPCYEAIERTIALGGGVMPEIPRIPRHHWDVQFRLNTFIYSTILFEMCREAGVKLITSCMLSAIKDGEGGVDGILTDKLGMINFAAKNVIDTTGDANAVGIAGYPLLKSEKLQPATLINHITGYELSAVDQEDLARVHENAVLPDYVTLSEIRHYLNIGRIDVHVPCGAAEGSEGKSELEFSARTLVLRIYEMLRTVRGLENIEITHAAEETGVRETCRIDGISTVSVDDYIAGKMYDDAICYAFYPVDLHVMDGIEQVFLKEDVVPTVPYGALLPRGACHILAAGRCISSDAYANSALRVQAVCMATSQAAACAAALAMKFGIMPKDLPYEKLVDALRRIGATVPEKI